MARQQPVKVYTDGRALMPLSVHRASERHHNQHCVFVVATSKAEAMRLLETYGAHSSAADLHVDGRLDPSYGDSLSNSSELLREAGVLDVERIGAVYAMTGANGSTGPIVDLTTEGYDVIGEVVYDQNTRVISYRPAAADQALRTAIEMLHGLAPTLPADQRVALRLVLGAARTTLTEGS